MAAGVLSGRSEIRADAKSHPGKIHTKVSSAEEQRISCTQGTKQSHLGGSVVLTVAFMVTRAPLGCGGIHATAGFGSGKRQSFATRESRATRGRVILATRRSPCKLRSCTE
jgi:hypothetical protein